MKHVFRIPLFIPSGYFGLSIIPYPFAIFIKHPKITFIRIFFSIKNCFTSGIKFLIVVRVCRRFELLMSV